MRLAAAGIAALALSLATAASCAKFPARIQVTAKEYYYTLSSTSSQRGAAIVQFVNYGEDPHDLRLKRIGGRFLYKVSELQPGDHYDLSITLVPGKYDLWCSIADHRKRGMEAYLIVK